MKCNCFAEIDWISHLLYLFFEGAVVVVIVW